MLIGLIPVVLAALFFLFSYLWFDYALLLTLAETKPVLNNLRILIDYGSANRPFLAAVFVFLTLAVFAFQIYLLLSKKVAKIPAKQLFAVFTISSIIFAFSYNLFTYDFFTYLFSSKILLFYKQNPYLVPPQAFSDVDFTTGFLRNVENEYYYGFVSLIYSSLPAFIFGSQKILLNIFFLRFLNAVLFMVSGYLIYRITDKDKKVFAWWFFNPLLVIELLINAHNDLLFISLFIISTYLLLKKKILAGILFLILTSFSKFSQTLRSLAVFFTGTVPVFLDTGSREVFFKGLLLLLLIFLQVSPVAVHVWYYSWLYMFVPFAGLKPVSLLTLSALGVLLMLFTYTPFIATGFWGRSPVSSNLPFIVTAIIILGITEFKKHIK